MAITKSLFCWSTAPANDTLTRLSARRRRLRAERRVRLGQLKNTVTFILSFVLTALAAVLAFLNAILAD